jgi:uncharacterized metal-binding protein
MYFMDNQTTKEPVKLLVMSCSGASNTGDYTDKIARKLDEHKDAGMACLPKISIGDPALIEKVKKAGGKLVVLDGCPLHCAKKILNNAGITDFLHLTITDLGIKKGDTPVTQEKIDEMVEKIKKLAEDTWGS